MKKIAIFLLLISTLFMACETDFEVNADWKEVMVVYGLLDQSETLQYIKINKAYLGEGDAMQMASVADSVNYNPENLEVKIFKVKDGVFGSIDTLGFVTLYDTILEKEDGLFATDENIIYTTPSNFFLTNNADEKDYILSIVNNKSGFLKSKFIVIYNQKFSKIWISGKSGFLRESFCGVGSDPIYQLPRLRCQSSDSRGQILKLRSQSSDHNGSDPKGSDPRPQDLSPRIPIFQKSILCVRFHCKN